MLQFAGSNLNVSDYLPFSLVERLEVTHYLTHSSNNSECKTH